MLQRLSLEDLKLFAGTEKPVCCNAGGVDYKGRIIGQTVRSTEDALNRFAFMGEGIEHSSQRIYMEGHPGDFFFPSHDEESQD